MKHPLFKGVFCYLFYLFMDYRLYNIIIGSCSERFYSSLKRSIRRDYNYNLLGKLFLYSFKEFYDVNYWKDYVADYEVIDVFLKVVKG